jgi:signal peptidase I
MVLTVPLDGLAMPGDVILFSHPLGRTTVVHRVVAVEHGAVDSDYVTKGDANEVEDGWRISVGAASGRVIATIPYLGYVLGTLRLPLARLGVGLLILSFVLPTLRSAWRARGAAPHLGHSLGTTR